ncbi:vitamin B12 ABC transporter ATP-binding protein BtuD [Vibrio sp. V27_P1S3P104]|uniref:vitamin B12 ABC transporter ATP-binding protein BtuD n=1 Tax=unclassified Vibrio TaxID=2614977 RepID=UPI001372CFC7|nr:MULTISPECIES: vitamin B12 ABC transporter ATP-binding protein BtuD [unclassified Vibrio]NAW69274.1 vitamin B12 ABC transporter ATP-binding protein BtuD [Vibrio sp. V28_P6S34P95]NAX05201.1 vitamin B12 ABC transporter ATP-binding protein BtuD [Vibrio sp. V30_P3S12P165]NAX34627.1 vitamin B12 ABC transporter ATP-binding protein BtuD [Vibrio sp. V29_P1S30P107]NAX37077.1 vitamin B12 ABC transporter ATP-binding protein BtuD [Vibrio sp. V27_P1S3P104]NAX39127.1 vitamin B12 ABC transporter ATP-bindin
MIQINSLQVGTRLLPLSFQCERGEVLHIIGPNGSGKSTLLAALAGMLESQGEVLFDDTPLSQFSLSELALQRAYLSQSDKPAFNLDVFQYLALSLPQGKHHQDPEVVTALNEICNLLNLADKLHRTIHCLSGGEWQRVRLAGSCLQIWPTLNVSGQLLILDEPGAPLDIAQEQLLYALIQRIADQGVTVVMANHDLNRSLQHADKVLMLDKGIMHAFGPAHEVLTENNLTDVFQTQVKRVEWQGRYYLLFD